MTAKTNYFGAGWSWIWWLIIIAIFFFFFWWIFGGFGPGYGYY